MKLLKSLLRELLGLFVDDGSLAVAIILWILLTAGLFPLLALPEGVQPWLWFFGLLALLFENLFRSVKARKK